MGSDWEKERGGRAVIRKSICPTGNAWLDDGWAGGVNRDQLVLVGAKTGVGKTHFGIQLAISASRTGRKVFYFALEAAKQEIERRRLYTELHRVLAEHMPQIKMPRYREWLHQEATPDWEGIERHAIERIEKTSTSLEVKYRTQAYSPEEFERDAHDIIHLAPDLIVLDHLHHFVLQGQENDALKSAIRTIDRLRCDLSIPIIVLAQVRKADGKANSKCSLSKIEDIRGTAALSDIATDVMVLSRLSEEYENKIPSGLFNPTFMHVGKSRTAPEMQRYVAIVGFDYKTGEYQNWYQIARNMDFEDPALMAQPEIPGWAKRARASAATTGRFADFPGRMQNWREND